MLQAAALGSLHCDHFQKCKLRTCVQTKCDSVLNVRTQARAIIVMHELYFFSLCHHHAGLNYITRKRETKMDLNYIFFILYSHTHIVANVMFSQSMPLLTFKAAAAMNGMRLATRKCFVQMPPSRGLYRAVFFISLCLYAMGSCFVPKL